MERPDGGGLIAMFFSVQVRDRRHLAHIMRALKRVNAVRRVQRART
jgi:(p)ppGpp synthase/HD superfamily hydrolase